VVIITAWKLVLAFAGNEDTLSEGRQGSTYVYDHWKEFAGCITGMENP
jgi:hypothetical protein